MLTSQPSIPTYLTPREIIGWEYEQMFEKHYRIAISGTEFPEKRLDKEFTQDERNHVIEIYNELRRNGFYPIGLNEQGKIRWGIALQDKTHAILLADLKNNPVNDIAAERKKARQGFKQIGNTPLPMVA